MSAARPQLAASVSSRRLSESWSHAAFPAAEGRRFGANEDGVLFRSYQAEKSLRLRARSIFSTGTQQSAADSACFAVPQGRWAFPQVGGATVEGMTIGQRLVLCRNNLGLSQAAMAEKVDLSISTLKKIETNGNVPSGETLLKYAGLGWNPGWILTGQGAVRLGEPEQGGESRAEGGRVQPFDAELLGQIVDTIAREATAAGVSLPHVDLGRLAGEKYAEMVTASADPIERHAMLKLMAVQLRKELRAPTAPLNAFFKRKDSGPPSS